VVALNVEDLEFCDEGVHNHPQVEDRPGRQRPDYRDPTRRRPFYPVKLLREWLDVAGISSGALFRQTPKGGKRVGQRITEQAYYDSSSRPLPTSGSTPASTAATPCGRVGYRRQPRTAPQCGR
jgi:hypothetical protein